MEVMTSMCPCFYRYCIVPLGVIYLVKSILFPILKKTINKLFISKIPINSHGKYAFITGATDGIGKALAVAFAKRGISLILVARNQEKLHKTKQEIEKESNVDIELLCIDFSNTSDDIYTKMTNFVKHLDIGILVNNVGLGYAAATYYEELDEKFIDDLIEVNCRSVLRTTRVILPFLAKKKKGLILNIGSGASVIPSDPLYSAYAATKSISEAFTRSLKVECKSKNITVKCHVPLLVTTKLSKCRTATLTTPSTEEFAKCAIRDMENPCSVISSPFCIHSLIISLSNIFPKCLWNSFRLSQCVLLRNRALKKKSEKPDKDE